MNTHDFKEYGVDKLEELEASADVMEEQLQGKIANITEYRQRLRAARAALLDMEGNLND